MVRQLHLPPAIGDLNLDFLCRRDHRPKLGLKRSRVASLAHSLPTSASSTALFGIEFGLGLHFLATGSLGDTGSALLARSRDDGFHVRPEHSRTSSELVASIFVEGAALASLRGAPREKISVLPTPPVGTADHQDVSWAGPLRANHRAAAGAASGCGGMATPRLASFWPTMKADQARKRFSRGEKTWFMKCL